MKTKTKILIGIGILCIFIIFLLINIFLPISNLNINEQTGNDTNSTNITNINDTIIIDTIATSTTNITANITISIENATTNETIENINNKTQETANKTNLSEIQQIKKTIIKDVDAEEAYKLINENLGNENFIIIDLRTPREFKSGHINGAINIDYYADDFVKQLKKLNKSKIYLVYCRSGGRSKSSLEVFQELNFEQIYHLVGGIESWKYEDFPVE